ncbi:hypothetical protein QVL79_19760, partial [Klebsiella pneumoniae]|nr:hypothetical protein [Klebsiella pneumoniae]
IENPRVLGSIPSPAPLFKEPAQKAGFCFSVAGLSIELRSIIRRTAAHPFGASAARALFNACGVSPSPGTKFIATDLHGGPFLHSKPAEINISSIP